ncbi:hypothetical protein LCGC14_0827070 [marine sediment metagenome]|uniref:Uncharacterized protein n=1 Tax=marine sediment metagenome TaxID=412755 RepID=A0A0F9SPG4_9ZZZZ
MNEKRTLTQWDIGGEMDTNTTGMTFDISDSDNSHIFGIPFIVVEGQASMDIPILHSGERSLGELRQWVDRVMPFERAGIEFHFHYRRG